MTHATPISHRHHYVPQFYLRQWVNLSDGFLRQYAFGKDARLREKPVSPRSTGYRDDLYSVCEADPFPLRHAPDIIETDFFSKVDNDAAVVLSKLVSGRELPLADGERKAWALFLNSLLERNCHSLLARESLAPQFAEQTFANMRSLCSTENDLARMRRVLERIDGLGMAKNALRETVVKLTKDEAVLEYFVRCRWLVLALAPDFELITTDTPIIINARGMNARPIQILTIAIGPGHLFVMHPSDWEVDSGTLKLTAFTHNMLLLAGEHEFVYARAPLQDQPNYRLRFAVEDSFKKRPRHR